MGGWRGGAGARELRAGCWLNTRIRCAAAGSRMRCTLSGAAVPRAVVRHHRHLMVPHVLAALLPRCAGDEQASYTIDFEEPSGANPLVEMLMKVRTRHSGHCKRLAAVWVCGRNSLLHSPRLAGCRAALCRAWRRPPARTCKRS